MTALTREQILGARRDRKPTRLEVPEWGGEVYVRVLSVRDQMDLGTGERSNEIPLLVIIDALVDENGERIFTRDDLEALSAEDFPVILRIFAFVAKINGLEQSELEAAMSSFGMSPDASSSTD